MFEPPPKNPFEDRLREAASRHHGPAHLAGAIGNGIVRRGVLSTSLGTSGVVFCHSETPEVDPQGRLHTFCHAIPGRWHVMGVTQAAGLSLRWFRDMLSSDGDQSVDYKYLTEEASQTPPGADGLLWGPYLMGERTPHLDPRVRAGLVGIQGVPLARTVLA